MSSRLDRDSRLLDPRGRLLQLLVCGSGGPRPKGFVLVASARQHLASIRRLSNSGAGSPVASLCWHYPVEAARLLSLALSSGFRNGFFASTLLHGSKDGNTTVNCRKAGLWGERNCGLG